MKAKDKEYALKAWWCTILGRRCDNDGRCGECEYAQMEKDREQFEEYMIDHDRP